MDNKGILITNLGTPQSLDTKDVKSFLTDFLMDKYVIDLPYFLRYALVKGIIVPARSSKSQAAYKKVWMDEGSPIKIYSQKLREQIERSTSVPVALAMRYGNPSTEMAFWELLKKDPSIEEVIVLPLYPHYTMSSLGTAIEEVVKIHREGRFPFSLRFLPAFYNRPDYITTLSAIIRPFLDADFDKLLFSYHGIPERHLNKDKKMVHNNTGYHIPESDYPQQCLETSRLVAEYLHIPQDKYEVSFQSRLAAAGIKWLQPYTADRLQRLPEEGVRKILVVCPAFVADCLETLEEIGQEGKEIFINSGGDSFTLIPCINDSKLFAENIMSWAAEIDVKV